MTITAYSYRYCLRFVVGRLACDSEHNLYDFTYNSTASDNILITASASWQQNLASPVRG